MAKVVDKPPSQHNKQILLFISDKLLESSGKYCTFCLHEATSKWGRVKKKEVKKYKHLPNFCHSLKLPFELLNSVLFPDWIVRVTLYSIISYRLPRYFFFSISDSTRHHFQQPLGQVREQCLHKSLTRE